MTDNITESKDFRLDRAHYVELSEIELSCIGHIVAQWGALECEIVLQTLQTFGEQTRALPKGMNNMQFSGVLELWKERVIDQCDGEKKKNLEKQHSLIHHYHDYRNALVHGMWDWDRTSPAKITTTRIRKTEMISTQFPHPVSKRRRGFSRPGKHGRLHRSFDNKHAYWPNGGTIW